MSKNSKKIPKCKIAKNCTKLLKIAQIARLPFSNYIFYTVELLLKNNIKGGSFPLKCLVMVMNLDFSQHQLLFWTFRTNCLKKDLFTFQSIFLWAIKIFIQWSKSVTRILWSKKKLQRGELWSEFYQNDQVIYNISVWVSSARQCIKFYF